MLPTPGSLPPTAGQNPRSPHRHRHRRRVGGSLSLRTSRVEVWRRTRAAVIVPSGSQCGGPLVPPPYPHRKGWGERENGREETVETYTHGGRRRRGLALRWLGASSCRRPWLGRTARGALSSRRLHLGLEREDGEVMLFFMRSGASARYFCGGRRGLLLDTQRESANQAKMDQWEGEEVMWH